MELLELILQGFKPLSLSNIDYFKLNPKENWQLILGTNGSGKSSLLRACTPSPNDRKEFRAGGFKHSKWMSDTGRIYDIRSDYTKSGASHSFKVDEVELNLGGTQPIQIELVEEHFGYTKYLHKLLTQKIKFTEMSRSAREALLIDISSVDFQYALELFEECKRLHRDTVGASKHVATKYQELCTQLDAMGDMEALGSRLATEELEVTRLLPLTNWSLGETNPVVAKLAANMGKLEPLVESLVRSKKRITEYEFDQCIEIDKWKSFDELMDINRRNVLKRDTNADAMRVVEKELSDLSDIIQRLDQCPESINADELEQQIQELNVYLDTWVSPTKGTYTNADGGLVSIRGSIVALESLSREIPTGLRIFSMEEQRTAVSDIEEATKRVSSIETQLKRLEDAIFHASHAKETDANCPNCNTRILSSGSVSDEKLSDMAASKLKGEVALEKAKQDRSVADKHLFEVNTYTGLVSKMRTLIGRDSSIQTISADIGTIDTILQSPHVLQQALSDEMVSLQLLKEKEEKEANLKKLEEYQFVISLSKDNNAVGRHKELETNYEHLLVMQNNLNNTINVYGRLEKMFAEALAKKTQVDVLVKERDGLFLDWIENEGTLEVTKSVREMQSRLGAMRNALTQWKDLDSRRSFLAKESEELKERKELLEVILKSLSPTHGLIAQQLRDSVLSFCKSANGVLGEIWEHELSIGMPEDEKKLSFNFELRVDGEIREDVKYGSTGEQDVINMAVTLIIMAQKGLQGYPMFMDEIGSSFDYMHRKNLLIFIRKLIATGSIGQLFMISHFMSEYGGMANCDVTALNTSNIQISGDYNQVAEMR